MKADQLRLALRPRPAWEAVDLGVRLAQDSLPSLARAWLPQALGLVVACLATLDVAPWLPIALLAWFQPWLERQLLTLYARAAFGQRTGFGDAWSARAAAPWGPALVDLAWGRLVPWRTFAAPVAQLEGQRGAARRRRLAQLASGQRGVALAVAFALTLVETCLTLGLLAGVALVAPGVHWDDLGNFLSGREGHLVFPAALSACNAAAVLLVTPVSAAAGFAMYLNRRAELEAWDVEQALRDAFREAGA